MNYTENKQRSNNETYTLLNFLQTKGNTKQKRLDSTKWYPDVIQS